MPIGNSSFDMRLITNLSDKQIAIMALRAVFMSICDDGSNFKQWFKNEIIPMRRTTEDKKSIIQKSCAMVKFIKENFSEDIAIYRKFHDEFKEVNERLWFVTDSEVINFVNIIKMLIETSFNHTYEEIDNG